MSAPPAGVRTQWLSFVMAGEEYALDVAVVREILRCDGVTRVPRVPAGVRGVVNLRGNVVPVLDVAAGLGLPGAAGAEACLVVVEVRVNGEQAVVCLAVDSVREVLDLAPEAIEPAPAFGTRVAARDLLGMARSAKGPVLLLDLGRLIGEGALFEGPALRSSDEAAR